ncbi:uncharacterized protein H6S33_001346 [Morchella sextelata]|uniref:uncharacterized protein n=1 Tax=Morchella sextelata TaxID=1174677 RepID=UPI001D04B2C0|nr:uncharacterized protein H6S33_001346 [Morchella sextelata]KAH0609118.1 hypothetical protein H6S33_001346 [Morchella sextelata]
MSSKYAALPDLDSSQDIYETPDLTDDVSTLPTTTSIPDDSSHENDSVDGSGLVTEHLHPTSARGRFKHSEIDARGVDFSDRISGKRRSYRASSRRRRRRGGAGGGGGGGGYEDEAGDEEGYDSEELYGEETLAMRVARLRREIEEVRAEAAASGGESGGDEGEEGEEEGGGRMEVKAGIVELSDALESLQIQSPEERGAQAKLAKKLVGSLSVPPEPTTTTTTTTTEPTAEPTTTTTTDPTPAHTASYTITYAPTFKHTHALAKAADFDTRLTVLEKCIGMPTSALSDPSRPLPASSIIPTLDELARQMSVLTSSSTSSLDAASRRVRQLTQEAEKLAEARKAAKAAADARAAEDAAAGEDAVAAVAGDGVGAGVGGGGGGGGGERDAKINALYGALPTIEGMGPMLPAVLDRLRSLRAIHADAGRAVEALARVERRQEEMAAEVGRWREALEKVEGVVGESRVAVGANMKEVEGWVRELEARCGIVEALEKGV